MLQEIESAQDGTFNLFYQTPDGGRKACPLPQLSCTPLQRFDCPVQLCMLAAADMHVWQNRDDGACVAARAGARARVALTVPAYVAADLLRRDCPDAAAALKSLDYPPVAAVTLAYPMSALRQDRLDAAQNLPGARPLAVHAFWGYRGAVCSLSTQSCWSSAVWSVSNKSVCGCAGFGQLHPRSQGITTLGTIYSSSLFPGRAPDGWQQLLCYIGGTSNRSIVQQPEDDIYAQAR